MATSPSDGRRPSREELAAIVAAITVTWPEPTPSQSAPALRPPGWRFSGRWWAPDEALRRRP